MHVLAVDLGASNGRVMNCIYNGEFEFNQLYRFPNIPKKRGGYLFWDVKQLWHETLKGIKQFHEGTQSVGVDSWGVDFGLLDHRGNLIEDPVHYRDPRTVGMMNWVFERISRREIFNRTGVQFLELNTLYQLASLVRRRKDFFGKAATYLGFPDLFNYWLTEEKKAEYTHATTTQCFNAIKKSWDSEILEALGIPLELFPEVVYPGDVLGSFKNVNVSVPACHDTGSAVVAVPSTSSDFCYLSSGTWSLMGTETKSPIINDDVYRMNFTNEGGVDKTNRLLKNLPGLWLEQELMHEWGRKGIKLGYDDLRQFISETEAFRTLINPTDPCFINPGDITPRILEYCRAHGEPEPRGIGEHIKCIYDSLALSYLHCLEQLESITGKRYEEINVLGGGSLNIFLNQHTANITRRRVIAGPVEATALGNAIIQFKCTGQLRNIHEARKNLKETLCLREYYPIDGLDWENAYSRYKLLIS